MPLLIDGADLANETANQIKLETISERMPEESLALGGYLDLWIGQSSSLPLSGEYTDGSMGELSATVLVLEVNAGIYESLFKVEVPEVA